MSKKKMRNKVKVLFEQQDGLCIYCGCECRIYDPLYHDFTYMPMPDDMATFEHLFDAFDIRRNIWNVELLPLHVWGAMACYYCNSTRGAKRSAEIQPREKESYYDIRVFLKNNLNEY
jgi:hypothetical protein